MDELRDKITYSVRDNLDKRKLKVMHPLDGRGVPLDLFFLKKCSKQLFKKFRKINFDFVVGFAEGGIVSAIGIADVAKKPFVGSYRVKLKEKNEIIFLEPHSMRAQHFIYGLKKGDRIIVIEDEITTGSTMMNAIKSFESKGIKVMAMGAFILNGLSREQRKGFEKLNIPLFYLVDLDDEP